MDVRIAELRDLIDIKKPSRSPDEETGENLLTWHTVASGVRAKVETQASEQEVGRKPSKILRYTVTIRYLSDLENQTDWRLVVDGQDCEITSAVDLNRRKRWLVISASTVQ